MLNIKKQNDMRINLSSFSSIYKLEKYIDLELINYKINNYKIINLNNFELKVKNRSIKYSTYYTNPYYLSSNIIKKINFDFTKNKIIKNLCKKIFLSTRDHILTDGDKKMLNHIIVYKNKYIKCKCIGFEHGLLILWFMIYIDTHINLSDKHIFYDLIKYFYLKFIHNTFDFQEIINNVLNTQDIVHKKFYVSIYILCEEFHYKYISEYLKNNYKMNLFLNSNYIKINPQSMLNDINSDFNYDVNSINENITNPFGHNILLIKSDNFKVYYYDPDENELSDVYKFKELFKSVNIAFFNISNRSPIQTISDDTNCVFYCLGLIKYIVQNKTQLELNKLKSLVLEYETLLLSTQTNIYNWFIN